MRDFKTIGVKVGKVIAFFSILIAILFLASHKIEQVCLANDNLVQGRNKSFYRILREKQNSIDVIVVGDSLSYSSISPMKLWEKQGIAAYVCGQSGQKIQETYDMLENAFLTQSPKVVVLETNTMFRGLTEEKWSNIKSTLEHWACTYVPDFRGHDIWKTFVTDKEYPEENFKGFTFRCEVNPYKKGDYMQVTEQKRKIPDVVIAQMEKIMDLCKKNGSKLLLLSTPSPVNYNYNCHNSLMEYAKEYELDYLNLNLKLQEIGINWKEDSLDKGDHLNLSGAEKVTLYLGQYLDKNYSLPDHRGEEMYASWDKEAKNYEKRTEECYRDMRK